MGLMDILNGMQNGPRGQRDPNAKGGMSPITMAIMALLAYKAYQKIGGAQGNAPQRAPGQIPGGNQASLPDGGGMGGLGDLLRGGLGGLLGGGAGGAGRNLGANAGGGGGGGGLGGLLNGPLGGLLAGGAAGSILSHGLGGLLDGFRQNGAGDAADSWVSTGPNKDISESDLAKSIGTEDLDALAQQTGMSRNQLLSGLREELPHFVDQFTPDGRVPSEEEAGRWA